MLPVYVLDAEGEVCYTCDMRQRTLEAVIAAFAVSAVACVACGGEWRLLLAPLALVPAMRILTQPLLESPKKCHVALQWFFNVNFDLMPLGLMPGLSLLMCRSLGGTERPMFAIAAALAALASHPTLFRASLHAVMRASFALCSAVCCFVAAVFPQKSSPIADVVLPSVFVLYIALRVAAAVLDARKGVRP